MSIKVEVCEELNIKGDYMDLENLYQMLRVVSIPPNIKQLNLGRKLIRLRPEAIANLTHLYIDDMYLIEECERPSSLQHLFIGNGFICDWKDVPNIYIEKYKAKKFISKYSPEEFHVFSYDFDDWSTYFKFDSYTISDLKHIEAFGFTINYRTVTKRLILVDEITEPEVSEPVAKLGQELNELNNANLPSALTDLSAHICKTFHQAGLQGKLSEFKFLISSAPSGYSLSDVLIYLKNKMWEYNVLMIDGVIEISL